MKLSEFKSQLRNTESVTFSLPNGKDVPAHFHITEAGVVTKDFIDCGGTVRSEKFITMQLWTSIDFYHRLSSRKLLGILSKAEKLFASDDLEVEIEYQQETIGRYGIEAGTNKFVLTSKHADCLAKDNCGIPVEKVKVKLAELAAVATSCCGTDSKCC